VKRVCLIVFLVVVSVLGVALASCSGEQEPGEITLTPPWEVGEKGVYEVKRGDEILATWEMRVESDEAGMALVSEMRGEGFCEAARVKVDPVTLFPEAMSFSQETEASEARYTVTFTSDEAIISVEPRKGHPDVPAVRVAIPEGPHYENETLLMVMRAMPLEVGFTATVQDVVTRAAKVAPVEINVVREEPVQTVLGEKDSFVVELVGFEQYLWVAKDGPRQILRFENKAAGTVSELTEYTAK
jgi:hypothetical protein